MAGDQILDYVGDAPVITDDRTRLDFTIPRAIESYFGISNSITDYYLVDQMRPELSVIENALKFCEYKQPVFPHVINTEASGLDSEAVRGRLDALLGSLPGDGCVGTAQARRASLNR